VKLSVFFVALRATAIAQSSAKNHRATQRDNGIRINLFSVELSVFFVALCVIAITELHKVMFEIIIHFSTD